MTERTSDDEMKEPTAVLAETKTTTVDDAVDSAEEADSKPEADDEATESTAAPDKAGQKRWRIWRINVSWSRVLRYGVLPGLALVLAIAAGFLKWTDFSVRAAETARIESVQAAKDSTVALLSYQPDTVQQQLGAARDLLTGEFKDSYTSLVNGVVIPGAKQQRISATASVPAAASASADPDRAVVLVFVNQITVVGNSAPTDTASSVRVTLEKVDGRWLVSGFDPI